MALPKMRALAIAAAAVGVAAASLADHHRREAELDRLAELWEGSGIASRHPGAAREIEREDDPAARRIAIGRALLADSLDARWLYDLPSERQGEEAERIAARLELARATAAEALRLRPTSWESAMLIGGARFIDLWRQGEAVFRSAAEWRVPLERADLVSGGSPEPERLLAAGYLSIWHTMTQPERDEAIDVVKSAFTDPTTLRRLLPAWIAIDPDLDRAGSILPPRPEPWRLIQEIFARQEDWEGYCVAKARWLELAETSLGEEARVARRRLEGGDIEGGRAALLSIIDRAPVDRGLAPIVSESVRLLPPGPIAPRYAARAASWLDWATRLWLLDLPTLPPEVLRRLSGMVPRSTPEEQSLAALGALASGDLPLAEIIERRSDRLWSELWAPYLVGKARVLLERGAEEEARRTLAEVHRSWHERGPYLLVRSRITDAPMARPGDLWIRSGTVTRMEVAFEEARPGLSLDFDPPEGRAAAVEVLVDGRWEACRPADGGERLEIRRSLPPGLHLVEIVDPGDGRVLPGSVQPLPKSPT